MTHAATADGTERERVQEERLDSGGDGIFAAIAHPVRRALLDRLVTGELPVNTLAAPFAETMSRPAVSQHLRVLREAGLVDERQAGRERLYRLRAERLREVREWLRKYERFWQERLAALGEYLEQEDETRR